MVRPYYKQEGGSKSREKEKKKHPEIPREANLNGIRPKMVQKNTKDMLTFRINSFNTLIFFSQKNLSFFFPLNTMDLPVEFPGRQSNPDSAAALQPK